MTSGWHGYSCERDNKPVALATKGEGNLKTALFNIQILKLVLQNYGDFFWVLRPQKTWDAYTRMRRLKIDVKVMFSWLLRCGQGLQCLPEHPAHGISDPVIVIKLTVIFFRHALYLTHLQNAVARRFARF